MERENAFEWNQFCRLGEMIGDGLHYEDKWISKEYKRLAKILLPETQEEKEYKRLKAIEEFVDSQDECYIRRIAYYGDGASYYVASKSDIVNQYTKSIEESNVHLRKRIDELMKEVRVSSPKKWYQKLF